LTAAPATLAFKKVLAFHVNKYLTGTLTSVLWHCWLADRKRTIHDVENQVKRQKSLIRTSWFLMYLVNAANRTRKTNQQATLRPRAVSEHKIIWTCTQALRV